MSLDKATESRNSQTTNKFPAKDGLRAEFYKHFSIELSSIFLDVYDI